MDSMQRLMAKMAKSKGASGIVVFVQHRAMPTPQPMRGRPLGTREEAEAAAREMLAAPAFTQAWTVGRDGIQEVSA